MSSTALLEVPPAKVPGDPAVLDEVLNTTPSPSSPPAHQAVRLEMVCRIRRLIDSGEYDNHQRLQTALDRLLEEMM